jgi:hypothetical protein
MAKRKKGTRRRKVSGTLNPKSPVVMAAAVAAGYFLGDQINAAIDKVIPASVSTSTGIVSYLPTVAEAGIGAYLLTKKGKPSLVMTAVGGVLLGAGAKRGLKKAGVIAGFDSVPVIAGYKGVPVIGSNIPGLSGYNVPAVRGYKTNNVLGSVVPDGQPAYRDGSSLMN